MEIKKYELQYAVHLHTKDNTVLIVKGNHYKEIKEIINRDRFIEINGRSINCNWFKYVEPVTIKPKVDLNEIYRQESENKKPIPKKLIEKLSKQAKRY